MHNCDTYTCPDCSVCIECYGWCECDEEFEDVWEDAGYDDADCFA